jgi:hypothetical protein
MKFAEGITNSLNFHAAEYITRFQAVRYTTQYHFEATKQNIPYSLYEISHSEETSIVVKSTII